MIRDRSSVVASALLALFVVWAPLPFGGVTAWGSTTIRVGAFAVLAVVVLAASQGRAMRPALGPAAALAGVALLGFGQSLAWPEGLARWLSPEHGRLFGEAAAVLGGAGHSGVPLTVAPSYTRTVALTWLALAAVFVAAAIAGASRRGRRTLLFALLGVGLFQVLYGARLWFGGAREIWGIEVAGAGTRLRGTFVNPDHLALYLGIVLPVAFAFAWWALRRARHEPAVETKVLLIGLPAVVWLVLFAGVAFTGSRAGLVAVLAGVAVQGLLIAGARRSWRVAPAGLIAGVVGVGVAAALGLQQALGRWLGTSPYELAWSTRWEAYRQTLELWGRFPWTGSGLGTFREAFPLVQSEELTGDWWHAHNDILEHLATAGVAGFLLLAVGLVLLARRLLAVLGEPGQRTESRAAALAALGALATVAVHSFFDFGLTMPGSAATLAALCGAALGSVRPPRSAAASRGGDGGGRAIGAAGVSAGRRAGGGGGAALGSVRPPRRAAASVRESRRAAGGMAAGVLLLALAALALAAAAWLDHRGWRETQRELAGVLEETGAVERRPEAAREVARQPDLERARLAAARELLVDGLDPVRFEGLEDEAAVGAELERVARQAERARGLARQALAARPASWEGWMVEGAALYLLRSLARDERLLTERAAWEAPLERAIELGPGRGLPRRFLVTAYLELWAFLPDAERAGARELLAAVFAGDPAMYYRLLEPWTEVALDREGLYSVVPDRPWAWSRLQRLHAGRRHWEEHAYAWRRGREALRSDLEERLEEGRARLRGRDLRGARSALLGLIQQVPEDRAFLPLLAQAVERVPAGTAPPPAAEALARHLSWVLELCLVDACPVSAGILDRMAALSPAVRDVEEAQALLLASRLSRAEALERRSERLWSEEWGAYLILKARKMVERGEGAAARAALERVHRNWHGRPAYLRTADEVARAAGVPGEKARTEAALAAARAGRWPATAWRWRGRRAKLELLAAGEASGVRVALDEVPRDGAVVALRWDGEVVAVEPVEPDGVLEATVAVGLGPHLLEVESVTGGRVRPGEVTLLR